mgnify:CR=1 FL=1
MDLLLFVVRGVSVAADALRTEGCQLDADTNAFVTDALFATITNANFEMKASWPVYARDSFCATG